MSDSPAFPGEPETPTEAATEAPTAPETEAPTQPERSLLAAGEPAMEPPTEPPTAPVTQPPTEPRSVPRPFFPPPPPSAPVSRATEPAPAPREALPVDPAASAAPREKRGARQVLVAGLAGGVVAALVAAGMYAAFDDNSTTTAPAPRASDVIVRPSERIEPHGDIAAILKADVPAVVAIVDDGGPDNGGAAGTGFVVSANGVIVTNNHVVEGANKIQAEFSDGRKLTAKVLGTAPSSDLAVIKVDGTNLPTIELGDSDAVQVGDDVVAIGNALGLQGGLSVTRGIVSGLHRDVPTGNEVLGDVIQTDAAINPGNSGGPLVDSRGRVIGINTAIADPSSAQNVGFVIPISQVKTLIDTLTQGKRPAFLGVATDARSTDDGARIESVTQGSPADKAGLEDGDVVVQVGTTPVHSYAALKPAIRRYKASEQVDLIVQRDGKRITLHVTLGEATEEAS